MSWRPSWSSTSWPTGTSPSRASPDRTRACGGSCATRPRRAGTIDAFPTGTQGLILDDHTPFTERGVRAIDLIDFDYPWFHTPGDTLDKVSARSLDQTGEALVRDVATAGATDVSIALDDCGAPVGGTAAAART